jgi:succinate dehydrogenase / fumarate reductase, cytochrome b subunit
VASERNLKKTRPKFLHLLQIRQPLPAVISLMHRISGGLLFFPGIPMLLWSLDTLLNSPYGYERIQSMLSRPLLKVFLLFSLWLFLHHFLAGVRLLALDLHYGSTLEQARASSKLVLAGGILLALLPVLLW